MPILGRGRIARMMFVEVVTDFHIQFAEFEFSCVCQLQISHTSFWSVVNRGFIFLFYGS